MPLRFLSKRGVIGNIQNPKRENNYWTGCSSLPLSSNPAVGSQHLLSRGPSVHKVLLETHLWLLSWTKAGSLLGIIFLKLLFFAHLTCYVGTAYLIQFCRGAKRPPSPLNMGNAARRSVYHWTLSLRVFMLYTHSLHVIHDHHLLFLISSLGSLGGPDRSLLGFPQQVDLSGIHVSLPENHVYLLRCMTSTVLQTLQWAHCLSSELEAHSCCDLHYRNIICVNVFIQ